MSTEKPLKCVHKGCGKTYTDPNEECTYHPGPPEFHEGQKGWMCCKPRYLTFDEFLSIPGCTTGKHSTVDDTPKPPPKEQEAEVKKVEENGPGKEPGVKPISVSERTVGNSLAAAMTQPVPTSRSTTPKPPEIEEDSDDEDMQIEGGMSCKRRSCGQTYDKSVKREEEKCVYHPGVPIFHEGSKGWTCCKRRVLEFEEFLRIEGCKERKGHCYIGKKAKEQEKEKQSSKGGEEMLEDVRNDFYQTPTSIIVSFYLKKIVKEKAKVDFERDGRTVKLDLPTSDGKRFSGDVELWGEVEPEECKSRVLGTKLELTLIKKEGSQVGWPALRQGDRDTGERIQVGRAGRA